MKKLFSMILIAGCLFANAFSIDAFARPEHHHGLRYEEELRDSAGYSLNSAKEYAYYLGKQVASGIISRKEGHKRLFKCISELGRNGVTSYPSVIQQDYQQGIDDVTYRRVPKLRKQAPYHEHDRHDARR